MLPICIASLISTHTCIQYSSFSTVPRRNLTEGRGLIIVILIVFLIQEEILVTWVIKSKKRELFSGYCELFKGKYRQLNSMESADDIFSCDIVNEERKGC